MAFHGGALERQTDRIARGRRRRRRRVAVRRRAPATGPAALPVDRRAPRRVAGAARVPRPRRRRRHRARLRARRDVHVAAPRRAQPRARRRARRRAGRRPCPTTRSSTDLEAIPRELRGLHPDNPVNVPPHGGVQIELPPRVRGLGPRWADWTGDGFVPPAAALVDALARVARSWARDREGRRRSSLVARRAGRRARGGDDDTLQPLPIEGGHGGGRPTTSTGPSTARPPAPAVPTTVTRGRRRRTSVGRADRRLGRRPLRRRHDQPRSTTSADRPHDRLRPLVVHRSGRRRRSTPPAFDAEPVGGVVADEPVLQRARAAADVRAGPDVEVLVARPGRPGRGVRRSAAGDPPAPTWEPADLDALEDPAYVGAIATLTYSPTGQVDADPLHPRLLTGGRRHGARRSTTQPPAPSRR